MSIPIPALIPWKADREALSPNQGVRKATAAIEGVVLHATADDGNEAGSVSWLTNPKSEASAHLLFHRDGRVTRLVRDKDRAWHAGIASWRGTTDVNSITLGWEIANRNDGKEPYTDAQYRAVGRVAAHYMRQGLRLTDFTTHAVVSPGRKTDPAGWSWERFRGEALAAYHLTPSGTAVDPGTPPLILEPIRVPQVEHVEAVGRALGIAPAALCSASEPLEMLVRAVAAGQTGPRAALAAELLGALSGYRARYCKAA